MASKTLTYNADTGAFVRNMEAARQSLLATGDASDRAKAKILENSQQQIEAALQLGKSQETLDRITQQTAASMAAVTDKNAARIEAAVDRRIAKYRAEAVELEKLGRIQVEGGGHGFTDRMAVSAVVRTGEGNPGIRSMENALTMIPGFGKAAQTLAPIIGFAGLTGLFVEMGVKGYEAFEKVQNASRDTARAFDELHEKSAVKIDDLEVTNQKIQDQIDKISGHPNNGVATALLEAKKRADELLVSLRSDRKELEELFKEHSIGTLDSFFTGMKGTGAQEKNILKDYDELQDKLANAKTPEERQKHYQDRIDQNQREIERQQKLDAQQKKSLEESASLPSAGAMGGYGGGGAVGTGLGDYTESIKEMQRVNRMLASAQRADALGETIAGNDQKLGGLKQGKESGEAERKKAEAEMKDIEAAFAEMRNRDKGNQQQLLADTLTFWTQWAQAPGLAKENRAHVLNELTQATDAAQRSLEEQYKQSIERQKKLEQQKIDQANQEYSDWEAAGQRSTEQKRAFWADQMRTAEQASRAYLEFKKKFNDESIKLSKEADDAQLRKDQASVEAARNSGRLANAGLKLQQEQGQISPHDAAVKQALIDTEVSDAEIASLQKKADVAAKMLGGKDSAAYHQANNELLKAQTDRAIQIQEDAARIVGTKWQGALKNSLAVWVQESQDSAKQVVELTQQAINGLNKNLISAMFGEKTDWAATVKGIGKTMADDGLKRIESAGRKTLGIGGKADGSASNPFHVVLAGGLMGSGGNFGNIAKSSADKFFGGSSDNSDGSSTSSFVGKTLGFFGSLFGGGLALGGDVQPGVAYDVGEMGRERFVPKTAGTIVPAHQLGSSGHTFNVDARGATDPAQTAEMVQRGIVAALPHIDSYVSAKQSDRRMRRPPTRGGS